MIDKLKSKAIELANANIDKPNEYKKYILIQDILGVEDCFLNMDIEYAYSILRDLGIAEEELNGVYAELISINGQIKK